MPGIALVQLSLVTSVALLWFGIPLRGPLPTLMLAAALFILVGLSLGLFISTISTTQQEAFLSMFLFLLPAIILSGFLYPIDAMPEFFQHLTLVNPLRHFLEIVRGVFLRGANVSDLWVQFVVLAGMAAAGLGVATWRFRATLWAPPLRGRPAGGAPMAVNHFRFLRGLWSHIGVVNQGRQAIYLDCPVDPARRWGWGRPPHPALQEMIAAGRGGYARLLDEMAAYVPTLKRIPFVATSPRAPQWANGQTGGLDAVTLYAFPKLFGSRRYVEVGSGHSTRFVRRSIEDHRLDLRITSIDPHPRAEVDELCDDVVRRRLEDAPLELFDTLEPNDVLMLDGSHRCFQNSDVTVAFLEVIPRLRPGVLVFVHDIFLPDDYPAEWERRFYSEQYLLGVQLLADLGRRYEVLFPGHFCATDPELAPRALELWRRICPDESAVRASGFWLRIRDEPSSSS